MPTILIEPGRRMGRTLANEGQMRAKLTEGFTVYTKLNGVFFSVEMTPENTVRYTSLVTKPDDLP